METSQTTTSSAGGSGVPPAVKEVRILETAEDIQDRRDQVLSRYQQFRAEARIKREKLEDSRKYQVLCYRLSNQRNS